MELSYYLFTVLLFSSVRSQSYECTTSGKFRYSDTTCRSFYMCFAYNGNYVKSNYTCPSNYIFDASSQTCSTNATCIEGVCDDLPLVPLLVTLADPNAVNCSSYIQCYGIYPKYPVVLTCPSGYYYNEGLGQCWVTGSC